MGAAADAVLVDLVKKAEHIVVFTGAGISTGSGIPDYRGPKGVWKTKKPVYYDQFMSSHDARVEYWDQKSEGWAMFRDAEPNTVHRAVASLEQANKLLMCITQNIDGLHSKAGTSDACLVELHGTNREVECQSCHERRPPGPCHAAFRDSREPPRCHCGGWLKPATISFGQQLRQDDLERAAAAARGTDLVIAMGSTLSVYPAANIPLAAAHRGVPYVIINRGDTDHDDMAEVTRRLDGDVAALFVPAVNAALQANA